MQQPEPAQGIEQSPEPSSIGPGELLMRRVPDQPRYFKNGKLQHGTFLPRKYQIDKDGDEEGLSFSRQQTADRLDFLTPEQFKQNCTDDKMRRTAGVLHIPVDDVWEIVGRRVRPDPTEADAEKGLVADAGHVIIPEINSKQFDDGPEATDESRRTIREAAAALAYRFSDPKHFAILPGENNSTDS
jgi:hypothetical protein